MMFILFELTYSPMIAWIVDQLQHDNKHEGQQYAVHGLGKEHDLDERRIRDHDDPAPITIKAV